MHKLSNHYILFVMCLLISVIPSKSEELATKEYKLPADSYELLLQMKYENVVKYDLLAIANDGKHYLPFLDIMSKLNIYYEFDYSRKIIEGFFIDNDSTFYLDFRTGRGESLGKEIALDSSDFLIDKMEVYVVAETFEKLFGFKANLNYLKLSLRITSKFDLPIKEAYKRFVSYNFLGDEDGQKRGYFPLRYDRDRAILNGGVMMYRASGNYANGKSSYSFGTNLGLEVLGGDITLSNSGTYANDSLSLDLLSNLKWRYNLGESKLLSNLSIGNLSSAGGRSSGLKATSFRGIKLTNETTENPISFSEVVYEDNIEPGWQVELYKDGFMVEHVVTDAEGYYRFVLPIDYGRSNIELRYFGPDGEYEIKKELINISSEFLSPGEIKYSFNLGETNSDTLKYGEIRLITGLTNWLTNSLSIIKTDSSETYLDLFNSKSLRSFDNMEYNNAVSLRLRSDLYSTIKYQFFDNTSVDLRYWPMDLGSYNLQYTRYDKTSPRASSGNISQLNLRLQFPRFYGIPLNFNIKREESKTKNNYSLQTRFSTSLSRVRLSANYSVNIAEDDMGFNTESLNQTMSVNASYSWSKINKYISFIKNVSFNSSFNLDLANRRIQSMNFSMNQALLGDFSLTYNLNKSFGDGASPISMALGLRYQLLNHRMQTNVSAAQMKDMAYSHSLEGSIGYNSAENEFVISDPRRSSRIGGGGAVISVFLDDNSDGKLDDNEKIIPNVRISIPQGTVNNKTNNGKIQVYNLIPYRRYNVTVDKESFENPLWIPKHTEFSFIADPNSYKSMNVPCYVGGVIEGSVTVRDTNENKAQAGVKIHILKDDSTYFREISVFSDGSFYYLGVPPGQYTAWVDSVQLGVLKCTSEPSKTTFEVKETTQGDFVSGLNFVLSPDWYDAAMKEKKLRESISVPESVSGLQMKPQDPIDNKIEKKIEPKTKEPVLKMQVMSQSFRYESATGKKLSKEMKKYLDEIVVYLNEHQEAEVHLIGHTDSFGRGIQHSEVSEARAKEAKIYLHTNNIAEERIYTKGVGSSEPLGDNFTPEGREKNRRLEIIVKE